MAAVQGSLGRKGRRLRRKHVKKTFQLIGNLFPRLSVSFAKGTVVQINVVFYGFSLGIQFCDRALHGVTYSIQREIRGSNSGTFCYADYVFRVITVLLDLIINL